MHNSIHSAAFMALLGIPGIAPAADAGFYLGAGIGQANSNLTGDIHRVLINEGFVVDGISLSKNDTGWKLFAGYAMNPYLAAELSYIDLGQTDADIAIGGRIPGRIHTRMEMNGITLDFKVSYPFDDQFSAFAKLGGLLWNAKATAGANLSSGSGTSSQEDHGADLSYGLGLCYAFTDHVSLRGDWDRYRLGGDADAEVDLWLVSAQYQF